MSAVDVWRIQRHCKDWVTPFFAASVCDTPTYVSGAKSTAVKSQVP